MANRAYLYSLSNQPSSYSDRPDTISGLSEWGYAIPLSYRILMSANPQLCSSLISDGFSSDPPEKKTRLYAISADYAAGVERLQRFLDAARVVGKDTERLLAAIDETEQ